MIMNDELGWMEKERVVVYFKVIHQNLPGGSQENIENPQSE
jgi:hypothetical protein